MSVSLKKGQRFSLDGFTSVTAAAGWDPSRYAGTEDFDLDLIAFLCDKNNRCVGDSYFVFFNNGHDPENAVIYSGDNLTGEGDGDDESISIDFSKVSDKVEKIIFAVSIYKAKARHQNFGMVDNSFVRLIDNTTGREICRYDLCEDFSIEKSMILCILYRDSSNRNCWKVQTVGNGFEKEIDDLCREYGLNVD